jgi:hypothetical protein
MGESWSRSMQGEDRKEGRPMRWSLSPRDRVLGNSSRFAHPDHANSNSTYSHSHHNNPHPSPANSPFSNSPGNFPHFPSNLRAVRVKCKQDSTKTARLWAIGACHGLLPPLTGIDVRVAGEFTDEGLVGLCICGVWHLRRFERRGFGGSESWVWVVWE